jgi:hypothetical protein
MVGEIKAVSEHDPTRIAGRGFIPATCIFLGRSIRLATLDITIEAAPKEIGAVHGMPDRRSSEAGIPPSVMAIILVRFSRRR